MEQFGYICSAFCRNQAVEQRLQIPACPRQKSLADAKEHAALIRWSLAGFAAACVIAGLWIWYAWFGVALKLAYSYHFAGKAAGSRICRLVGPGRVLFLAGGKLELFDARRQKEVWSVAVAKEPEIDVEEIMAKLASTNKTVAAAGSKAEEAARQALESIAASSEFAETALLVTNNQVWLVRPGGVQHFDLQTGATKEPVELKTPVLGLTHDQSSILAVSAPDLERRVYTRIDLASGEARTKEVSVAPKPAKPAAVEKPKNAAAAARQRPGVKPPPTASDTGAEPAPEFVRDEFAPAGADELEMKVKLLEARTVVVQAMRPKQESVLNSANLNASQEVEASQELLNDMNRQATGGVRQEDASRYRVTLHRVFDSGAPDWTGEVAGAPALFPLQTVTVLVSGNLVQVFDKQNKKLWENKLTYSIRDLTEPRRELAEGKFPCIEAGNSLYLADRGMLTAYELAGGTVRWRLNTVGIHQIQIDSDGYLYIDSTTAGPESIQFTEEANLKRSIKPLSLKVDSRTGALQWQVQTINMATVLAGKFVYGTRLTRDFSLRNINGADDMNFNLYRFDRETGKDSLPYFQPKAPLRVEADRNWILLQFPDEYQLVSFFSL